MNIMKNGLLLAAASLLTTPVVAQNLDLPPNAKPGQCWSRVLAPANYQTMTDTVVVQPASERLELVPAKYEWIEKQVVVEDAYEKVESVPAKFETKTETIIVEPERMEYKVIPAQYKNVTERVKVRDAYTTWKKGKGPITRVDQSTGEILCLVEVPAEYREISKQVLVSPERTDKVNIPAKTKTVTRRVMVTPAKSERVRIPAKVETVRYQKLVTPAQQKKIPIAEITKQLTYEKKISGEKLQWAEILCETNVTPSVVRNLQTALKQGGFYKGSIDGDLGASTLKAVDAYQRRNGLSTGSLTIQTMRKLGVATSKTTI